MDLFEQYGIKEVADVTLYSIHRKKDGSGELYYVPALHFDTLKISSTEKTAETTWAEGGCGNERLIPWDHSKRVTVNLEDALCTPATMGLCWGGVLNADWKNDELKIESSITNKEEQIERMSRFEESIFPDVTATKLSISRFLPHRDCELHDNDTILLKSSVVDGTDVRGFGSHKNKSFKWHLAIESSIKSIAMIPDRFFDLKGRHYLI